MVECCTDRIFHIRLVIWPLLLLLVVVMVMMIITVTIQNHKTCSLSFKFHYRLHDNRAGKVANDNNKKTNKKNRKPKIYSSKISFSIRSKVLQAQVQRCLYRTPAPNPSESKHAKCANIVKLPRQKKSSLLQEWRDNVG